MQKLDEVRNGRCGLCGFCMSFVIVEQFSLARLIEGRVMLERLYLGQTVTGYRHHATGAIVCIACPGKEGGIIEAIERAVKALA